MTTLFIPIVFAFLMCFALAIALINSYCRGEQYKLDMPFMFAIQMGEHSKRHRLLSLTLSFLTMFIFIYYANDITAEMTSGPAETQIRNFGDVIHGGFKVVVYAPYYKTMLGQSRRGTHKHEVN